MIFAWETYFTTPVEQCLNCVLDVGHLRDKKLLNCTLYHNISTQFYSRYSDYMGPLLSDLSADLTHLWVSSNPATAAGTGDSIRFIYYNGANFAVKSTVNMLTALPLLIC